jgi:hypothetical protein
MQGEDYVKLCECGECGLPAPIAKRTNTKAGWVKGQPMRFIHGHQSRIPESEHYRLEDRGYKTPCWIWQLSKRHGGYGQIKTPGRPKDAPRPAHIVYYERYVGPIPAEAELDHLCRVPACVNPDHLEPVTHAENVRRGEAGKKTGAKNRAKTHCPYGHPYDATNTYVSKGGRRHCRTCRIEQMRKQRQKTKGAEPKPDPQST